MARVGEVEMELTLFSIIFLVGIVVMKKSIAFRKVNGMSSNEYQQSILNLIESSKDVIYFYEVNPMKFKYISPSLEKFLGHGVIEEAFKNPNVPFERIHPDDYEILSKKVRGELDYSQIIIQRWKDNSGKYRWFEEYATPVYANGQFIGVQGIIRNIDEKVKLQQELEYRIYHDTLTDIYNRDYFENEFESFNRNVNVPIAVVICDLDELKFVNDTKGHKAGDKLIIETARLLNQFSSDDHTVSRIGGDEFALIVTNKMENQIKQMIAEIRKTVEIYNLNHSKVKINMSIGYGYSPTSNEQMEAIFSHADKCMYEDKLRRKGNLIVDYI